MKFLTKSQARDALIRLQTTDTSSADAKGAEVITTWKLKKIPVTSFNVGQLKRVLILICKEKQLVVSNFADLTTITEQVFINAFRLVLDDIGMTSAKTDELYIVGGQSGYLSSRFHKDTRNLINLQDSTEFDFDIDKVEAGSIIILDSDVTELLYPNKNAQHIASPEANSGNKRDAFDDTLFMGENPEQQKRKLDGGTEINDSDAAQALPDWEDLKTDPIKEALVGRLQSFYQLKIDSVTTDLENKIHLLEESVEKRKQDEARFRGLIISEESETKLKMDQLEQQCMELTASRDQGLQLIQSLKTTILEQNQQMEQIQNQIINPGNQSSDDMDTDSKSEPIVKTNTSSFIHHQEEPTSESCADKIVANEQTARINSINKGTAQAHVTSIKPATIGKFGIKIWNEENSLLDHMAQVSVGLEVAAESGHDALSVQKSLIYQSLPTRCHWTRSYVSEETTVDGIIRRIITLLEGGKELQLHAFMKIQRMRNEPLLEFFTKIRRIYAFSVNKKDEALVNDQAAVSFMVQKMVEAMEEATAQEFTKRIESDLEQGKLTFGKIADAIIRITRLAMKSNMTSGILAHVKSGRKYCNKCKRSGHDEISCWKDILCSKCDTLGHPAEKCKQFPTEGQERETKTEGRICYGCKERGHILRNCTKRQAQEHSKWSQNK